jgi:hypothetical protein
MNLKRKESQGLLQPGLLPYEKARKYLKQKHEGKTLLPVFPHQRVGEIVVIAVGGGFIGAKVFNAFESWEQFISDPTGSLFSGAD